MKAKPHQGDKPRFPPIVPLGNGSYSLFAPYEYRWEHEGAHYKLVVPEGFTSDMASVPRLLWFWIGPFDLGPAAIVHDFLYRYSGQLPMGSQFRLVDGLWEDVSDQYWSRRDADRLFARMMRESGVTRLRRRLSFLAVRMVAGAGW